MIDFPDETSAAYLKYKAEKKRRIAAELQSALDARGLVIVPREATEEILKCLTPDRNWNGHTRLMTIDGMTEAQADRVLQKIDWQAALDAAPAIKLEELL